MTGHSFECRINAECSDTFTPSPGPVPRFYAPGGPGIRVDTAMESPGYVDPSYDSMIAKLITVAQTREEAISKMKRALSEFILEGVKTTIPFHKKLMNNKDFIEGNYTTKFMEQNKL